MASFAELASVTASTKRSGGIASGLEAAYAENIASLKCLPLDPVSADVVQSIPSLSFMESLQTAVEGGLDILEGDILVVAGTEYPIRAIEDWTWPPDAKVYQILYLEDKK